MKVILRNEGRYNFHEVGSIAIMVRPENCIWKENAFNPGDYIEAVELTPSQIKRVRRHFCGISDCLCGSSPAGWETIDSSCRDGERVIVHL